MKIFFDARFIRTDFHDGISRYSTELGKALAKLTPVTFIVSNVRQLEILETDMPHVIAPAPGISEPSMSQLMNRYKPDVVFSPMQTFGSAGRKFKLILTSHDMIYYNHRTPPQNIKNPALRFGWYLYHLSYGPQRLQLNSADVVATVSHTSQADFEGVKLTKRPIVVIPNAPEDLKQYVKVVKNELTPKNLIYMGSSMPYKNVETLIQGMEWLPGRTLHLLRRVKPARRAQLERFIPEGANVVFHNGVTDEQYAKLLADNAVLVTASLYEGFGLPIAEALSIGVPAVISDIPIFHEVAGGGALYFDPLDPQDFAHHIIKLDDKSLLKRLVKAGPKHISKFTWEGSAKTLFKTIKSLL